MMLDQHLLVVIMALSAKPKRLRAFRSIDLNALAPVSRGMSGSHHSSSFKLAFALSLRLLISVGLAADLGKAGHPMQCF